MKWLYHYLAWRFFGGHYRKHQCKHRLYRGDGTVYACCVRAKHHFGKHDFWV